MRALTATGHARFLQLEQLAATRNSQQRRYAPAKKWRDQQLDAAQQDRINAKVVKGVHETVGCLA